ncbi:MAG: hypothetical protein ACXVBW_10235 [Bdellovibrionota bacterium]
MHPKESHGRLSFLKTSTLVAIPAFLALGAGIWLALQAQGTERDRADLMRLEEVDQQARMLGVAFHEELESLRARALAGLSDPLLHWARLSTAGGKITGVLQKARNPQWNPESAGERNIEDFYLQTALETLSESEIRRNGSALVRIRRDVHESAEWLAFAFAYPAPSTDLALVLVDPAQAFPIFSNWTHGDESLSLRGYLVGSDGVVLAHTERNYVGMDFASVPVFQKAAGEVILGTHERGSAILKGIDQLNVAAAFVKPAHLPLGIIVEKVLAPSRLDGGFFKRETGSILASLGALLCMVLFSATFLYRAVRGTRPTAPESDGQPPFAVVLDEKERAPEITFPIQNPGEMLLMGTHAMGGFSFEEEDLLLRQFEKDASQERDPQKLAVRIVTLASRVYGSPAMFFIYQPTKRAAILSASAGFAEAPKSMAFPVLEKPLADFFANEPEGKIPSFSDYPALKRILEARVGAREFEAWGISHDRRLIGVLAVLPEGSPNLHEEFLARMVRATGQAYEKTLSS